MCRFEYGDDGILTVQIHDQYAGQKKRFAIQQAGEDQMDASQLIKLKRINEELVNRTMELENTQEFKDAVEVLKKTEQDVIRASTTRRTAVSWRNCAGTCGRRWVRATARRWKRPRATLNDRLLNYAYLL